MVRAAAAVVPQRAWLVPLAVAVLLAGCTGSDGGPAGEDPDDGAGDGDGGPKGDEGGAGSGTGDGSAGRQGGDMGLEVISESYGEGEAIPTRYTCEGENVTPPWRVDGVPDGTVALAALFDDPDAPAGTWTHWLAWDMDATDTTWPEGGDGTGRGTVGTNSFGRNDYGGPCPPEGHGIHHYTLTVWALDTQLGLDPAAQREDLLAAVEGHVLAQGSLMGTYER